MNYTERELQEILARYYQEDHDLRFFALLSGMVIGGATVGCAWLAWWLIFGA